MAATGCFGGRSKLTPSAEAGFSLREAPFAGTARRYYAYVPKGTAPAGGWPLLVFLHGGGEGGEVVARPTQVGLGPVVHAQHGAFPFVVLFPQAPRRSAWTSPRAQAHVLAAVDDAINHLSVDRTRVYVVGNSMGAHGALHLAARHPGRFAALVAVAGRAGKSSWFPTPPDAREDLPRDDPHGVLADAIAGTPAWLVHGADNPFSSPDESRKLAAALEAKGSEVQLTIYPGTGHAGAWERAWADAAIFAWLTKHALPALPEPKP